jgi:hypothetical protein
LALKNLRKKEERLEDKKEALLAEHLKVSKAEDKAKARRVEIEAELEKLYGDFDGKSKTFNEEKYKVTIKKNFVQKLDQEKYIAIRPEIPEELRPEKVKFDLDSKGFEWLKENNREVYLKVSDCVTEKQNKSTVSVEKI